MVETLDRVIIHADANPVGREGGPCAVDFDVPDRHESGQASDLQECGWRPAPCHGHLDAVGCTRRRTLPLVASVDLYARAVLAFEYKPVFGATDVTDYRRSGPRRIVADNDGISATAIAVPDCQRPAIASRKSQEIARRNRGTVIFLHLRRDHLLVWCRRPGS